MLIKSNVFARRNTYLMKEIVLLMCLCTIFTKAFPQEKNPASIKNAASSNKTTNDNKLTYKATAAMKRNAHSIGNRSIQKVSHIQRIEKSGARKASDSVVFPQKNSAKTTPPSTVQAKSSADPTIVVRSSVQDADMKDLALNNSSIRECMYSQSLECDRLLAQHYPKNDVQQLIVGNKLPREVFMQDYVNAEIKEKNAFPVDNEEKPFCETIEYLHFIQVAENKNGEFRWVVQSMDADVNDYKQGIRVGLCSGQAAPGNEQNSSSCSLNKFSKEVPVGYTTKCVQKYMYRQLYAIKPGTKSDPYKDTFKIPSCCMCMYKAV